MNNSNYDIAIIGAGINGSTLAYQLSKKSDKKIVIFDMNSIAGGGSGAAGAFISPKFSKKGELRELLNDAFLYSMDFYEKNFPAFFTKAPLIHIAKDSQSSEILTIYKQTTPLKEKTISSVMLNSLKDYAKEQEKICLDTGIVDADGICNNMCENIAFINEKVTSLVYKDSNWIINETYIIKDVVLATGAYEKIIDEPYINLRGIWGHRIDIKTSTKNNYSIHQDVSISPTKNGISAIGATHNVHYHPQITKEPYNILKGREELLYKMYKTVNLKDVEVIKDYTGLRSGTVDYMPLLGDVVISKKTLQNKTIRFDTKKVDYTKYDYYPNLYIINGSGGYGFVLAPYLAKILSEHILKNKPITKTLLPARFFARWARRL